MTRPQPAAYRLRIAGHLDDHWAAWFGHLTMTHEGDGTTTITGDIADQAALHGVLNGIRDLGLTLLAVEAVLPPAEPERGAAPPPTSGAA